MELSNCPADMVCVGGAVKSRRQTSELVLPLKDWLAERSVEVQCSPSSSMLPPLYYEELTSSSFPFYSFTVAVWATGVMWERLAGDVTFVVVDEDGELSIGLGSERVSLVLPFECAARKKAYHVAQVLLRWVWTALDAFWNCFWTEGVIHMRSVSVRVLAIAIEFSIV